MNITLCTFNVKGVQNKEKRMKIFQLLENKNFSICLLQETRIAYPLNKHWKKRMEW